MRPSSERERAFLNASAEIATPTSAAELGDIVREAEADGTKVTPAGLGEHAGCADAEPAARPVSLSALDGIALYEPDDYTIGVHAGMPLAALRDELARNGQELPADLGTHALGTVGGLVARAPIGPRQDRHGSISSLLLGAEGIRGNGRPFRSGGMVVKNVAGYQVHKFLVGAHGRTGFVLRANFRLRPLPEVRHVRFAATEDATAAGVAARALRIGGLEATIAVLVGDAPARLRSAGLPVPDGAAAVGWLFEGPAPRVRWLAQRADEIIAATSATLGTPGDAEPAQRFLDEWVDLGEVVGTPDDTGVLRISTLATDAAAVAANALEILRATGCAAAIIADPTTGATTIRWSATPTAVDAPVSALADLAREYEGVAHLQYLPPSGRGNWPHRLTEAPTDALVERLLRVFDPAGTFGSERSPV